jgi:hypothetical protein
MLMRTVLLVSGLPLASFRITVKEFCCPRMIEFGVCNERLVSRKTLMETWTRAEAYVLFCAETKVTLCNPLLVLGKV